MKKAATRHRNDRVRKNVKLGAQPSEVARLFAEANLSPSQLIEYRVIHSAISAGDYGRAKQLCDRFARPEFGSPLDYYTRKQCTALVSKVPFTGDQSSRKRRATESFWEAEARCRRSNRRLAFYWNHTDRMSDDMRLVLTRARRRVSQVLGQLTEGKLARVIELARPGSGVSIGTHNRFRVSLPFKLGDTDLVTTEAALPYARMLVETSPQWLRLHADVNWETRTYTVPYATVESNKIAYVPKDARTLRTIAIEPSLNVCLQLGVHSYICDRLKRRCGIDLSSQSVNQNLARFGSDRGFGESLATLDLSSASDSLSIELVRWLLPSDWFSLLDDLRCKTGTIEGRTFRYEKFSSMGNGFTFALETLIFWALGDAVNSLCYGGSLVSVYGDDIILPDTSSALMTEALAFCGFKLNSEKSFVHGPFRESCGADWHSGCRVTPQYIRKAILRPTDVYSLLNRGDPVFDWAPVRDYLLSQHREKEPVLYGLENEDTSSCLFASFDYVKGGGLLNWRPDWQTWTFKTWVFEPESEKVPPLLGLAAALFGSQAKEHVYQLRGRGKFRLRSTTPGRTLDLPRII